MPGSGSQTCRCRSRDVDQHPSKALEDIHAPESESDTNVVITEEDEAPAKALPAPKKERTANTENRERVRAYIEEHHGASVREVVKALNVGVSTANKWMQRV